MDLQEAMRKHFRVSVNKDINISIKINEAEYEIVDVGHNGIGIKLGPEDILVGVDDELPIKLTITDTILNLQGKVVHISPEGPGELLCGIEFINIDKESKLNLLEYLEACREKIFTNE